MSSSVLIATESQLGRSGRARGIERRPLVQQLRARGIRMTAQRSLIVEIIQNSPRHLDAAGLLRLARQRDAAVDRATVYRTISLLKRLGLIDELDLMHIEGEKHYYEVKTSRDHCHLACFRCGAIMEYASGAFEALKKQMASRSGFRIATIRLEAGGVCGKCRKAHSSPRPEAKQPKHSD